MYFVVIFIYFCFEFKKFQRGLSLKKKLIQKIKIEQSRRVKALAASYLFKVNNVNIKIMFQS